MNASSSKNRAFSLLELIVVIMIIGIIAAFTLPAASTILRGSQLSQASQIVTDQFSLARQTALAKNRSVEVRLIKFTDPEVPSDSGAYRAIQTLVVLQPGSDFPVDPAKPGQEILVPNGKAELLAQSVVMDDDVLSSLIKDASAIPNIPAKVATASGNDPKLPRKVNQNYSYAAFRFLPDGSTNLPPTSAMVGANGTWCVTVLNMNDEDRIKVDPAKKPANFFTLQVDPVTGKIKGYRPSM